MWLATAQPSAFPGRCATFPAGVYAETSPAPSVRVIAAAALSGRCADLQVGVPLPALQTPALTVAPGVAEAAVRALTTLFAQARANGLLLAPAQRDVRELGTALSQEHPPGGRPDDLTILLSIPGVGIYVASTLLGEAHDLIRRRDYRALRAHRGAAPVKVASGKSEWVIRRLAVQLAVQHELRQALYHWRGSPSFTTP